MARNMITGKETQKMQEFTQEQIDRAEHMGIALPVDVKEQIFEYANLIGEEEKVRTLVRNLTDAIKQADEDKVEELLDDAKMDIQDLPDPTIGKLELRDYGYTAEDIGCKRLLLDNWLTECATNEGVQVEYGERVQSFSNLGDVFNVNNYCGKKLVFATGARGFVSKDSRIVLSEQSFGISAHIRGTGKINKKTIYFWYLDNLKNDYFWASIVLQITVLINLLVSVLTM